MRAGQALHFHALDTLRHIECRNVNGIKRRDNPQRFRIGLRYAIYAPEGSGRHKPQPVQEPLFNDHMISNFVLSYHNN
jgi:hypothetical protein